MRYVYVQIHWAVTIGRIESIDDWVGRAADVGAIEGAVPSVDPLGEAVDRYEQVLVVPRVDFVYRGADAGCPVRHCCGVGFGE
jgi:hypothetical protein